MVAGFTWLAVVASLTLRPVSAEWLMDLHEAQTCLICGYRGAADAVLNAVLFLPLGIVLGGGRRAWVTALVVGAALSASIEGIQLMLPGRHAGIADIVWNSTGSVIGVLVSRLISRRLAGVVGREALAAAAITAVLLILAGSLLKPSQTDADYWGQLTPDLGSMPRYRGRVLNAQLNGTAIYSRRIEAEPPHRALFAGAWTFGGEIVVGPGPRSVSPILSIFDGNQEEVVLLGAHGNDLVFRERTLARGVRLDSPDFRVTGAFALFSPGDTVTIAAWRDNGGLCLRLEETRKCDVGATPGRSWGLLLYLEGPSEGVRWVLDQVWLMILFAPLGLLARTKTAATVAGGIGLAGLLLSITLTPFVLGPCTEFLACVLGVAAGRAALLVLQWIAATNQASA